MSVQVYYSEEKGSIIDRKVSAEAGFSVWTVDEDILTKDGHDGSDLVATLYLKFTETLDYGFEYAIGPNITISKSTPSYDPPAETNLESHIRTVAIVVPVTVVVVLLALGVFVLWSWRRNRRVFGIGLKGGKRGSRRTSSGYNHGWPGDKDHQVELTGNETWHPSKRNNVFREEIRRQEIIRGF